jgi:nucleotide-binding universal stress UspA family protein
LKVLLAIDESDFAAQAAREVESRLCGPDTTVRVIHVVASFIPPAVSIVEAGGSLEGVKENVVDQYQELVDRMASRLRGLGLSAEGVVREGNPAKAIVDEAREWDADLIILGAHGLTGLESLIMGNVARHVVDHAPCSVEVVRLKKN